ncbi:TadE/TadG family type IV pilus assembly protein [Streptomyces sp. NPDC051018]|uniref:TadE/TadG family type IV pilus assembly protein n=1 Tax=Streptomyces sp. NPDC051018 TaxID=3365639 RepID=UPI0037A7BF43
MASAWRARSGRVASAWRARDDRGQAAIEFAGTLPLILVTLALLWQAALIGYTFSLAGNAADAAARAGAVGGAGACAAAAREDLPSAWSGAADCRVVGDLYKATVGLRVPVLFPGAANLPLTVSGEAAAPNEDPDR